MKTNNGRVAVIALNAGDKTTALKNVVNAAIGAAG